jgi:uncharacterized protein YkvS
MIVIFNGPPASGKDEAASLFKEKFGFGNLSFKYQLFKETIEHFKVDKEWFMEGYNDRSQKEKKEFALGDRSRREAMIHVSEDIIKPRNGKSFFGWKVSKEIEEGKHYAIADGGFIEELEPIIEKVGNENIIIVQLTREGYDYSTDSRRYFNGNLIKEIAIGFETKIDKAYVLKEDLNIRTYRVHNNGSVRNFQRALTDIYNELNEEFKLDSTNRQITESTNT